MKKILVVLFGLVALSFNFISCASTKSHVDDCCLEEKTEIKDCCKEMQHKADILDDCCN